MLISGCSGLLGQKLVVLAAQNHTVYGFGLRERSPVQELLRQYMRLDLRHRPNVMETVQSLRPEWVINTAAWTDVDACEREPQRAFEVNVEGLRNLTEGCVGCGARFVQLSTNYVFDGTSSPYNEEDTVNPVNVYGQTKVESERLLQESKLDSIIIRTVLLYGSVPETKSNFVNWVCSNLESGERIRAATDLYCNPTLIDDLAHGILIAVEKGATGLFHMAGNEGVSRYDFAVKIAKAFEFDSALITPVSLDELKLKAPRPLRAELKADKAKDELGLTFRSVEDGLDLLMEQMKNRRRE